MRKKLPEKYHRLNNKSRIYGFIYEKRKLDTKERFGHDNNQRHVKVIPNGTVSVMINNFEKLNTF